jgi:hypothetical protein
VVTCGRQLLLQLLLLLLLWHDIQVYREQARPSQ